MKHQKWLLQWMVALLVLSFVVSFGGMAVVMAQSEPSKTSPTENLAFNPLATGYPHPLESDRGWGGGARPWDIVDGVRNYDVWYRGLAFTGGSLPYIEPAGWRQATINFGEPTTFNRVTVWHSSRSHVPMEYQIEYWDGAEWVVAALVDNAENYLKYPDAQPGDWWYGREPTENVFETVTSSKVRFKFDNSGLSLTGDPITHGWIKNFEVYHDFFDVTFNVTASDGDPLEGATVKLNGMEQATGSDGSAKFEEILPGSYTYEVRCYDECQALSVDN